MEEEYYDKDNRSKRFTTTNFKKRDNKREIDHRNVIIERRLQQSLKDRYGEDYEKMIENGEIDEKGEKINGKDDFDWSEDEKNNGPKNKKNKSNNNSNNNNNNSKKSKAEKQKELEEDYNKHAPKKTGLRKY